MKIKNQNNQKIKINNEIYDKSSIEKAIKDYANIIKLDYNSSNSELIFFDSNEDSINEFFNYTLSLVINNRK